MCAGQAAGGYACVRGGYESSFELAGFCENGWVRTKLRGLG
ncbi:hypothetical protein V1283_001014 [Bradyrhizobium sp. AZCC 2262]|jgi:hypothetical protein